MTIEEIRVSVYKRLNNQIRVAYMKFMVNPPSSIQYFPDKWELVMATTESNKLHDKKRQKSFKISNYEEGVKLLEDINHQLIKSKTVMCEEGEKEYFIILQWN